MATDERSWAGYNDARRGREPRELLRRVLAYAGRGQGRQAVDLGAGAGIECKELLAAGWSVLAVDSDPSMPDRMHRLVGDDPNLKIQVSAFEEAHIPPAALIYAGFALPFLHPASFPLVWQKVREALRPGAWLGVDLFGERDSWITHHDMTFHSRPEVDRLLEGLQLTALDEEERDGAAFSGPKHWHVYHVIGRQP